jgi:hypothetical protein
MGDILVDVARSLDVLHQIHAVGLERLMNAFENAERSALIVDGVERRNEVELFGRRRLVEIAQVTGNKLRVLQRLLGRLGAGEGDRLRLEIHPRESALREPRG